MQCGICVYLTLPYSVLLCQRLLVWPGQAIMAVAMVFIDKPMLIMVGMTTGGPMPTVLVSCFK